MIFFYNSMVFFVFPMSVNFGTAIYIITWEIRNNPKFLEWARNNKFLACLFTIFAAGDVQILEVLSSNFAELEMLNAPLSQNSSKRIMRVCILCLFIRDIPKLIVQVSCFLRLFFFSILSKILIIIKLFLFY